MWKKGTQIGSVFEILRTVVVYVGCFHYWRPIGAPD